MCTCSPTSPAYIGVDHVAMLLATLPGCFATGVADAADTVLALDIGTNTEICLAHCGQLTSLSCASGPAFEGAHITFGMRAAPGPIEQIRIADGRVEYKTIGDEPPVGLCGSGILDAIWYDLMDSAWRGIILYVLQRQWAGRRFPMQGVPMRKITISLPRDLVDFADRAARHQRLSRSRVISQALAEARARSERSLAEAGYRFYAGESAEFAQISARAVAEATAFYMTGETEDASETW